MVEARRVDRFCERSKRLAQRAHEGEELVRVEGEGCAAAGEGVGWVGEGGELGAGQVVAVHWEGCGDGGWSGGGFEGVEGVDPVGHCAGEFCFAGAWDAADSDQEAGVGGDGAVFR